MGWEYTLKAWVTTQIISEIGTKSNTSGCQGREVEFLEKENPLPFERCPFFLFLFLTPLLNVLTSYTTALYLFISFTEFSEVDSPTSGQLNIEDFAKNCQVATISESGTSPTVEVDGRTHSRNSSNHSGSGTSGFGSVTVGPGQYGSLGSQNTQHSRQSSLGDSGHMRAFACDEILPILTKQTDNHSEQPDRPRILTVIESNWTRGVGLGLGVKISLASANKVSPAVDATISPCDSCYSSGSDSIGSFTVDSVVYRRRRNASNSSSGQSEFGSIDRKSPNTASLSLERRQKIEEGKESKLDATRVNHDDLVDELLKNTDLQIEVKKNRVTGSCLQLLIGKDGKTTLGSGQQNDDGTPVILEKR
ncbi:uncharacterized protein LOC136036773 [Artemia franciscana]|uniref:uncharacterized protein LOC136036773 n=1 Tax=Artemia franciscana TaxID=6661 RepID=UPI0032DA92C5